MLDFTPKADPVTGGTAVAKLITIDPPLKPFKIDEATTTTAKVFFDIIKTGSYNFLDTDPTIKNGATTGLSVLPMKGTFDTIETDKTLDFTISGTPKWSLEGNSFAISKAVTLYTGAILSGDAPNGGNAYCDRVHKPMEFATVTSRTGSVWMDRNLGAGRVAQSANDYQAFGCLFQWGRGNDGHASINWTSDTAGTPVNAASPVQSDGDSPGDALFITAATDWRKTPNPNLWQKINGINNPCPANYRLPTSAEFAAEITAYSISDATTAWQSALKFTRNKFRDNSGHLSTGHSFYWTSNVSATNNTSSSDFSFDDTAVYTPDANAHAYGFSVRCIKDEPKDPVTGGTAVATLNRIETISKQLKIGEASGSKFLVPFKVTKAGTYSFTVDSPLGATTGLSIVSPVTGTFAAADEGKTVTVEFPVIGTPVTSFEGNTFKVSGITTPLNTGKISDTDPSNLAICDGTKPTPVVEITGRSGRIWMDRNLGASHLASSKDDYQAFGCLFQWGRGNDGAASMNWTSATQGILVNGLAAMGVLSDGDTPGNKFIPDGISPYNWRTTRNDELWQGVDGKNNPCPTGYRVPTTDELYKELSEYRSFFYLLPLKLVSSLTLADYGNDGIAQPPDSNTPGGYWSNTPGAGFQDNKKWKKGNTAFEYFVGYEGASERADYFGESLTASSGLNIRCIKDVHVPVDTGGSATADFLSSSMSEQLRIGKASTGKLLVRFKVTKAGNYSFTASLFSDDYRYTTTGLSVTSLVKSSFAAADVGKTVTVEFPVSGTPDTSLTGNFIKISGINEYLGTGAILPFQAICDDTVPTEVKEVSDSSGRIWMDRNLGASRVAQSVDDYKAFGCLYQWGRGNDGAASMDWISAKKGTFTNNSKTYNAISDGDSPGNWFITSDRNPYNWRSPANHALWQGVDGKNNPCPSGFRLPTQTEFQAALRGRGIRNIADAYATTLKLVRIGIASANGVINEGTDYWTCSVAGNDSAFIIYFRGSTGSYVAQGSASNICGASVRCIKN